MKKFYILLMLLFLSVWNFNNLNAKAITGNNPLDADTSFEELRPKTNVNKNNNLEQKSVTDSSITIDNLEIKQQEVKLLSEFFTSFKGGAKGRINNIKLAAKKIDNVIVKPNEIFSFNATVGPTTQGNGFMIGRIFINGKESKGYGGGVCQVSSTLYNAAIMASIDIIERHPHSLPVGYVPKGKDAATSYGGKDFKLKNNKDYPIKINTYVMNDNVYVAIEKV